MRWAGLGARASACPSHRGFWPRRCGPVPGQGAPSATASPSLCALSRLSPGFQPQEQVASNKAVSDSVSSGGSAGRCESPCGRGHGQKCGVRGALPTVGRSVGPGEVGSQASGRLSLARTAPPGLADSRPLDVCPPDGHGRGLGGGGAGAREAPRVGGPRLWAALPRPPDSEVWLPSVVWRHSLLVSLQSAS